MDYFNSMDEFRQYAPGVDATLMEETLTPSFNVARKKIRDSIGNEKYEYYITTSGDEQDQIKLALANYTMYEYKIFDAVSKNADDGKLYKYQLEDIKEKHLNMFWSAMDELLSIIDVTENERTALPIKNAKDFSYYFSINNSGYFFQKVIYLIREIYADEILTRIGEITPSTQVKLKDKALRGLCYNVMARAIEIFDVSELPESIRRDVAHEFTKSGSQLQTREKLVLSLSTKAQEYYRDIEQMKRTGNGIKDTVENRNSDRNKFYTIS